MQKTIIPFPAPEGYYVLKADYIVRNGCCVVIQGLIPDVAQHCRLPEGSCLFAELGFGVGINVVRI